MFIVITARVPIYIVVGALYSYCFFHRIFGFRCVRTTASCTVYTHQIRTRFFFVNRYLFGYLFHLPATSRHSRKGVQNHIYTSNYLAPVKGQRVVVVRAAAYNAYVRIPSINFTSGPSTTSARCSGTRVYLYIIYSMRHVVLQYSALEIRLSHVVVKDNRVLMVYFHGKIKTTGSLRSTCCTAMASPKRRSTVFRDTCKTCTDETTIIIFLAVHGLDQTNNASQFFNRAPSFFRPTCAV